MLRDADRTLRALVLVVAIALGAWLRLDGVGELALFGDEYHTLEPCEADLGTILTRFDDKGSHTVLPLLQHVSLALFGHGTTSLRLPALVPGVLLLLLLYPLSSRAFGAVPACLATAFVAVHPMLVYYTRFARSYALIVLLGILLLALLARLLEPTVPGAESATPRRAPLAWLGVTLLAFLLPYTHLSTAGFVAAAALVGLALAGRAGWGRRPVVLAFGAGAALCGLAFLPLLGQVRDYFVEAVPEESKDHPSTWFGIPLLLAGSAPGAWLGLLGVPVGLLLLLRERTHVGWLAAAGVLGPLVSLLATRPHGMEYAYARYLLLAVPVAALVLAWLLRRGLGRVFANGRTADRATLGAGLIGVLATVLAGPFAAGAPSAGPFENTYLAIRPLPAYDGEWPDAPAIYRELAREREVRSVVELPPMFSRAVLLYRHHQRVHGHRTRIGWPGDVPAGLRDSASYVGLEEVLRGEADVVVLHKEIAREVSAYWRWVNETRWPEVLATSGHQASSHPDRGYMLRHEASFVRGQPTTKPEFVDRLYAVLSQNLGPPQVEDERVAVWRDRP